MREAEKTSEIGSVYFAEIISGRRLELRDRVPKLSRVPMVCVTDCKSLYDCLHGVGKRPSEARLILDIDALKEFDNIEFRWVNTKQMIADPLTKPTIPADYLLWLMDNNEWMCKQDPALSKKIDAMQRKLGIARREAWQERRARADAHVATGAEDEQLDREIVERRGVATTRFLDKLSSQLHHEDPRDDWETEEEILRRLAGLAVTKMKTIVAVRVHFRPCRQTLDLRSVPPPPPSRPEQVTGRVTSTDAGRIHWSQQPYRSEYLPNPWRGFTIFIRSERQTK
jgi:hypothetical protein